MVMKCEDIWPKISDYLEGDVDPSLKPAMEEHFAQCSKCKAVLDGTRNIVGVYGDEQLFTLPVNFDAHLRAHLANAVEGERGTAFGWAVSIAAIAAVAALIFLSTMHDRGVPQPFYVMSQPARRVPHQLVVVGDEGKTFHVPGCPFIHGKTRTMPAEEAVREGYSPCVRCMKEAIEAASGNPGSSDSDSAEANVEASH